MISPLEVDFAVVGSNGVLWCFARIQAMQVLVSNVDLITSSLDSLDADEWMRRRCQRFSGSHMAGFGDVGADEFLMTRRFLIGSEDRTAGSDWIDLE